MVEKAGVEVADNEEELIRATNGEVEDIRHVSDLGLDAAKAIRVLDEAIAACSRAVIVVEDALAKSSREVQRRPRMILTT